VGLRSIANILANLLPTDEREAVLGDLAEAGESGMRATAGVFGLVVRRQATLWLDWRPWLTLVGFVIPAALALHLIARWDAGLLAVEAFRKDLPWFARFLSLTFATLACWSFLGGGVLRTIAPRTLIVQISALLSVMIVAQVLDLMSYVIPAHRVAHQDSAYGVVAAWLVQLVFVTIPLVWGAFQRLPRIVILGVILTVAEFILQLVLRPRLRYYLPEFVMGLVVFWPFAYIAIRTGNYWTRVCQHRS
jgi:hypothetical protein